MKMNMIEKKNNISIEPAIEQFLQKSIQHDRSYARKRYRWHAQYSLDRADGIDQTNVPVTDELENLFLSIEDRRALYAALQRLSSLQRRRLLMRYADRLTYSEIARREGVAPRLPSAVSSVHWLSSISCSKMPSLSIPTCNLIISSNHQIGGFHHEPVL